MASNCRMEVEGKNCSMLQGKEGVMKFWREKERTEEEKQLYKRAQNWQIALFTLSSGAGMAFYILMAYVSYIANAGYGITVAVTGVIMTATRMFDGFTDPIVALLVDRLNTRFGKIRILMWLGWGIESLACLIMYVFGSNGEHGIVFFIIAYMLYIIGYTLYGVSTNIVGPVMTNDPKQRPVLGRWQTIYSYLFPTILNMGIAMYVLPKYGNKYNIPMLREICIYAIIFAALMTLLASIGVSAFDKRENFISFSMEKKEEKKIGTKDMWKLIRSNHAFQTYIISSAADKLALSTGSQSVVSIMFYGILIGNIQLSAIFSLISMVPAIIFLFIATGVAARKGNKESMIIWTKASLIAASGIIVFCSVTDMSTITRAAIPTVIFFGLMIIYNGFKMGVSACTGSMMSDIVDYEMSRTSSFMPGVVAATYSFVDKLISSLSSTIAAFCVALIGFKTVMPQPKDEATTPIFIMTMILMFGFPILGWICSIVAMKFYPLTKEKMIDVQRENKKLRGTVQEIVVQQEATME